MPNPPSLVPFPFQRQHAGMRLRRTPRSLSPRAVDVALLDAFLARRTLARLCDEAPVGGAEQRAAIAAIAALDGLAEALTGYGKLWHPASHRAGL
jgi:hypothetical protein